MRYVALAADYDGTLAKDGRVSAGTVAALERFVASGRKMVLVTGRTLDELEASFPRLDLFDRVVVENGAVVYVPATRERRALEQAPSAELVSELRARHVEPLTVGEVIVATREPHHTTVLETIRSLGLELHVEFNKGAVMVLPPGTSKRSGLLVALEQMRLSPHNVVGVGDAENDHALLRACECAVAVANALPSVKSRVDWVTPGSDGEGVAQLVERILADDLESLAPKLGRHRLVLGHARRTGAPVTIEPYGQSVLVAGPSGSGKTSLATAIVERMVEQQYQICLVDPEGDYERQEELVVVGSAQRSPSIDEVERLLYPGRSVAVGLLALPIEERAAWFATLLARVRELRTRTGRPHWLVVDEAHHVLPETRDPSALSLSGHRRVGELMLVTAYPERLSPAVLREVDVVACTSEDAGETIRTMARASGSPVPKLPPGNEGVEGEDGHRSGVLWSVREGTVVAFDMSPARWQHLRHKRKYATGDLGDEKSFWFRGPSGALHLRAQNLTIFLQIARGVDDATWLFHLRAGDYSRWFEGAVKDPDLAEEARSIEHADIAPSESRKRFQEAIEKRYAL